MVYEEVMVRDRVRGYLLASRELFGGAAAQAVVAKKRATKKAQPAREAGTSMTRVSAGATAAAHPQCGCPSAAFERRVKETT